MSLFMMVTARVDLPFLQIDSPVLTADAAAMVDRPDVFAQRFGNAFVRGIARGGFFVGLIRIETTSSKETDDISAALQGSYGLFSASASTNFQSVQSKFHAECFIDMYHEGGPIDLTITDPSNPMQLLDNTNKFLQSFVSNPDQVAVPYEVTIAPIAIAQGPLPPNEADLQHAQDVLLFCARRRSALLDQLNLLQYMVDNPSKFDFSNGAKPDAVRQAATDTQADLDTIASCAGAAINHPGDAKFPNDFAAAQHITFPQAVLPNPLPTAASVANEATVTVPDMVRTNALAALRLIRSLGLTPQYRSATDATDAANVDRVISQSFPPGTPLNKGAALGIVRRDLGEVTADFTTILSEFGLPSSF